MLFPQLLRNHSVVSPLAALAFFGLSSSSISATFFSSTSSNMSFTTQRVKGTITVSPKRESDQSGTVIICHGLGDTAEGFVDVAEHLATQMPHLKFILPTAHTQPVSMNMNMPMPSWYDIVGLDERSNEFCRGIDQSRDTLRSILAAEHSNTGLPYSRMVLAGFSQGGALSLYTGLQLPQKLAGILVMSGYLPAARDVRMTPGLESTPILHCHGTADPLVKYSMAEKSKELLTGQGATNYKLKAYRGMVHTVSMEEIGDVATFLKQILPPDTSCRVTLKDPNEMSVKELKEAIKKAGLGNRAVGLMEKREFVKLLQDHREGK